MNPAAILALISDLYQQVTQLKQENTALKQRMQEMMVATTPADGGETHD